MLMKLTTAPPDESAKKQDEKLTKFREINARSNILNILIFQWLFKKSKTV